MPKGKAVTAAERQTWLEQREKGERLDHIAKQARRSISTVQAQIQRARQDREQNSIRAGLLQDAYRSHFEDLLEVAAALQQAADGQRTRTSLVTRALELSDARGKRDRASLTEPDRVGLLLQGLRRHLPASLLWKELARLEAERAEYEQHYARIRSEFRATIEGLSRDPALRGLGADGFVESLWFAAENAAQGQSLTGMTYQYQQQSTGSQLCWGAFALSGEEADDRSRKVLRQLHERLFGQVVSSDAVEILRPIFRRIRQSSAAIGWEVETLRLRRILPGRCDLCPR